MPANLIAVNLGSYGRYRENALEHLQTIGIRHVEIGAPDAEKAQEVQGRLSAHGLAVSTLIAPCDLTKPAATFESAAHTAKAMGVRILFISAKAGEMPMAQAHERLRELASIAGEQGVTLSLETHPHLAENATVARRTIEAVGHPAL